MGVEEIDETDCEFAYICDECGQRHEIDNCCRYGCLYLVDDRELPPKVLGIWCDENCMRKWFDKHHKELLREVSE